MSPRAIAAEALWQARRGDSTVVEQLEGWIRQHRPESPQIKMAYELGLGAARHWISCEALARLCTKTGRLDLNAREKALLVLGLYQMHYMGKPDYAIVDTTMELAHRYARKPMCALIHALLRTYCRQRPQLPQGDSPKDIGQRLSYPESFVRLILEEHGSLSILEALNQVPTPMVRLRPTANRSDPIWAQVRWLQEDVGLFEEDLRTVTARSDCIIQNITQVQLMQRLAHGLTDTPQRILDLCAAPGGKTLLLRDLYPHAFIWANDISAKRLERLHDNQRKYGMAQQISCSPASELQPDQQFDLIVVDAPCSNSGVLHKRPEARWRLDQPNNLRETQCELLAQARRLLAPGGVIWYLTCSILSSENQKITGVPGHIILPNIEGWDGGYAAQI